MAQTKWLAEEVIGNLRVYARVTRSAIVVRVENDGDTSKYVEWKMPKLMGLGAAMSQAAVQTTRNQIRE